MPKTERGKVKVTVKEGADGQAFLALEPLGDWPAVLRGVHLYLDLAPDTAINEAQELARSLNDKVRSIAALTF